MSMWTSGGGSVRGKGGMGTRKSSRRKGAHKDISTGGT